MLMLLPSTAQQKTSKLCNVGIHWIALAEYYQMSNYFNTRVSAIFQSVFLHHFVLTKSATCSIRVKVQS